MSLIAKLIGVILIIVGGVIIFTMGADFIWLFLGMFVLTLGFSFIIGGKQQVEQKPPPPTVTEIRCDSESCEFKEIRNFEKGDFVLKQLSAKCPKCASTMTIQGVYVVNEDPDAEFEAD